MFARDDPSKNKCAGQDLEWANFDIGLNFLSLRRPNGTRQRKNIGYGPGSGKMSESTDLGMLIAP
jgi:hypothetical protein